MSKAEKVLKKLGRMAHWAGDRPPVIVITGMGASGKTSLTKLLSQKEDIKKEDIKKEDIKIITLSTDWYFTRSREENKKFIAAARATNKPKHIAKCEDPYNRHDWVRFEHDFTQLMEIGELYLRDMYDKKNNGQMTLDRDLVLPTEAPSLVVVEGLYLLDGFIRKHADYVVHIDRDAETLLERRRERELKYGKTPEDILASHLLDQKYVAPYYAQWAYTADVILRDKPMRKLRAKLKALQLVPSVEDKAPPRPEEVAQTGKPRKLAA